MGDAVDAISVSRRQGAELTDEIGALILKNPRPDGWVSLKCDLHDAVSLSALAWIGGRLHFLHKKPNDGTEIGFFSLSLQTLDEQGSRRAWQLEIQSPDRGR